MNALIYVFRTVYHFRFWLIVVPALAALITYFGMGDMNRKYEVNTTIYTGVVSGYNIENTNAQGQDWNSVNNAMDNLMNIIIAQTTLKRVSMRLYAQAMMYGDPKKDNTYISAANYRRVYDHAPAEVRNLIDKDSEEITLSNLYAYERLSSSNYVYGLFNWTHPHYSYGALKKIMVKRLGNSDMLEVTYTCDDPGIAYNTLLMLNEEFMRQYEDLRFGETNNVIGFFEAELERLGKELKIAEDSLTDYSVDKKVINYSEQTKYIAALGRDFAIMYEETMMAYKGSETLVSHLEKQINDKVGVIRNNAEFISKINKISTLTSQIAMMESLKGDSLVSSIDRIRPIRRALDDTELDVKRLVDNISEYQYTKEGIASSSVVGQWLTALLRFEKSKAELEVLNKRKALLEQEYVFFSPIGSTLKRKEREISFKEQSYLTTLNSLNAARLRQKNMQMTSAKLNIINPPVYPISAMSLKRKFYCAGAFVGALMFMLGLFLIIELLDRTLRDKFRAEKITKAKVIGASPIVPGFKFRSYYAAWMGLAVQNLCNSLVCFLKRDKVNIINIVSNENDEGKDELAENMVEHYSAQNMKAKVFKAGEDFEIDNKAFYMAESIMDLVDTSGYDIVIVVYPALNSTTVTASLLREAMVNLFVARANRGWKDTDQLLFEKLAQLCGSTPMFMFMTKADKLVVETFTGLLPPFTYARKLGYKLYQFGLTSKDVRTN